MNDELFMKAVQIDDPPEEKRHIVECIKKAFYGYQKALEYSSEVMTSIMVCRREEKWDELGQCANMLAEYAFKADVEERRLKDLIALYED